MDAARLDGAPALDELAQTSLDVGGRVFDEQDAEWRAHELTPKESNEYPPGAQSGKFVWVAGPPRPWTPGAGAWTSAFEANRSRSSLGMS